MGDGLKRAVEAAKATWDPKGPSCATCEHFDGGGLVCVAYGRESTTRLHRSTVNG